MPMADSVLLDVSLRDRVIRRRNGATADDQVLHQERYQTLNEVFTEEQMSSLDELTGDAKARVTVSADLASSIEFGNKAGAMVSISVTCDNSEEAIRGVHEITHPIAKELVQEDLAAMILIRDKRMAALRPGAKPEAGTVGVTPPARTLPKPPGPQKGPAGPKKGPKTASPGPKRGKIATPKPKPNFQR